MKRDRALKGAIAAEAWAAILGISMAQRDRFMGMLDEFDLTPGAFRALATLGNTPQPMGLLAQMWRCDASNVTWTIDRLEERGLVERQSVPADRRVKAIALTTDGAAMRTTVLARLNEPPEEFLDLDHESLVALRDACARLPISIRSPDATKASS